MMRRSALANTWSSTGPISRSGVVKPGHLGVGGVDHEQVDALLAEPGERAQVGDAAVERQLVHLEVAGVQHRAGRGAHGDRERVGDRVVDGDELALEGAEPLALPLADRQRERRDAVLLELGLDERERELEPMSGMSGRSRSRYGTAPMWSSWPCVRTIASMSSSRSAM